ncbi:hypothetical protein MWU49_00010 [Alcanivorax sp. S6407]|uniref:hypothetical protein n=1 Tax=Alcanivorax sp. S6407 TaxID=2926424 RepID=UPI001FF47553|nr:hypothetical protein [Alcanivorax sp. S6407]MCK0152075.1 hypothetical protein [Alcanivorax sp. S6407]
MSAAAEQFTYKAEENSESPVVTIPAVLSDEELSAVRASLGLKKRLHRTKQSEAFLNKLREVKLEGQAPSDWAGPTK